MKSGTIAGRMFFFLAVFAVVMAATIAGTWYLLHDIKATAYALSARTSAESRMSFEIVFKITKMEVLTHRLVRQRDPAAIRSLLRESEAQAEEARQAIQSNPGMNRSVQASLSALLEVNEEVEKHLLAGEITEGQRLYVEKSTPAFEALLTAINQHHAKTARELEEVAAQANARATWIQSIITIVVVASVLVLAAFGLMLRRSLITGLGRMLSVVSDIAQGEGDLTKRLDAASSDELGQLAQRFNLFLDKLHRVIAQVARTAELVASASEQISSSAAQQAQAAETQKDQATQVSTAMQEMASIVLQVSENSTKAAEAARQAAETARHGGTIVEQTLDKMRVMAESVRGTAAQMADLGKSSDQIGRIIGVIDDIADQTNLLALNAAIEAARAGEQGRGFAVVADEVRKLAERTTTATREIAQMIKNIQNETKNAVGAMEEGTQQVEQGVLTTSQAGASLKEIIQMAQQVGDMITHIATAATQQSRATEEVNANVEQIASLVKASADGAQQSARACEELSTLALDLQRMVGNFKLGGRNGGYGNPGTGYDFSNRGFDGDKTAPARAIGAAAH
jgi:methyl-accepting chemotaxis protein